MAEGSIDMYRGSRFVLAVVLSVVLGLTLRTIPGFGAHGSIPLAGPGPHPFPPGNMRLYRTGANVRKLVPLRLRSLADMGNPILHTGLRPVGNDSSIAATADGSKFAVMENIHPNDSIARPQGFTLQLFDGKTGKSISSLHHLAVPFLMNGISTDGSVIYGSGSANTNNGPCANSSFYLADAGTGRLLQHFEFAARPWDAVLVGPNHGRLYTMTSTDHINFCGPSWSYSPTITAYDLHTGKAVRSVRLKGVLAGLWDTSQKLNGFPVGGNWTPGFALSPDGSQIAVLDGHTNTLILLRAATLQVEARERLARPSTGLRSLAALLELHTDAAEAKGQWNGANIQIQYTPDGRSLIETGGIFHPDKHHFYSSSGNLGMKLIDVAHGQIKAWLHDRKQVISIWPAPDGSAVYSSVQGWSRKEGWLTTLRYQDPTTLRVRAKRVFTHMGNWSLNLNLLFLQNPIAKSKGAPASKELEISDHTFHRRRTQYSAMKADDAKELRLEQHRFDQCKARVRPSTGLGWLTLTTNLDVPYPCWTQRLAQQTN